MKKLVKYGVLPACLLLLAACSSKPATEKKPAKEDKVEQSSESKEEKTKKQIEKDGDIILRAIFTDHSSGFTTLMGTSVDKWKKQITEKFVDENASKYLPAEDFTLELTTETFTPEKILELFDQARFKVLATIGDDYEITKVEDEGDTATVTFKSRAIATRDLANLINRAKSSLFENGIEDVKKLEDNTDPDLEKRLSLLNNFLFYYAFDRLNEDFGYIEPREYTLELTKTKEGRYILSDESFLELRKEIFVNEYSADGAETRKGSNSSKSNSSTSKDSDTSSTSKDKV